VAKGFKIKEKLDEKDERNLFIYFFLFAGLGGQGLQDQRETGREG
jgi:hypothetical protein